MLPKEGPGAIKGPPGLPEDRSSWSPHGDPSRSEEKLPKHKGQRLQAPGKDAEKVIVDLDLQRLGAGR